MWIARDKDGILNLFTNMPHRNETCWIGDFIGQLTMDRYWSEDPIIDRIDRFETLKWEDEPIEVSLLKICKYTHKACIPDNFSDICNECKYR